MKKKISFQKILNILTDFEEEIAHLHFSSVTHKALNFIQGRLGVRRASVALLRQESGGFLVYDAVMDIQGIESGSFLPFHKTMLLDIIKSREPLYRPDIKKWKPEYDVDRILLKAGIRANFSIPLMADGQCIGTLNAGAMRVDGIGENKRIILQMLAPRLAQMIQTSIHVEALTESKELVQSTISSMDDLVFILDKDLRFLQFCQPAKTVELYLPPEKFIGRHIGKVGLPSEVVKLFYEAVESLETSGSVQKIEYSMPFPDGTRWYSAGVFRRMGGKGNIAGFTVVARDITKQQHDENALRESEGRYRRLVENIEEKHIIYTHDINGVFTYLSPSIENILGYTPQEFMSHYTKYLTDNPVNEEVVRHTELSIKGKKQPPYEVESYHKDGSRRWLEVSEVPVFDSNGSVTAVQGISHDITERKRIEEEMKKRGDVIKSLNDALVDLAKNMDLYKGDLKFAFEAITEAAAHAVHVQRTSVWLYSDDREVIRCMDLYEMDANRHSTGITLEASQYPAYFNALKEEAVIEAHNAHTDPRTSEFSDSYLAPLGINSMLDIPIRAGGQVVGVVCHEHTGTFRRWTMEEQSFVTAIAGFVSTAIEAHERKMAEEALIESEARWRSLVENAPDIILSVDREGQIIFINHPPEGLTVEEAVGTNVMGYVDPEYREVVREAIRKVFDSGNNEYYEIRARGPYDTCSWYSTHLGPVKRNDEVVAVMLITRDITARKQIEDALSESEERYKKLLASVTDYIFTVEVKNGQPISTKHGPGCLAVTGYLPQEFDADPYLWYRMVYEDDRERVQKHAERVLSGEEHDTMEHRIAHKNGNIIWVRNTPVPRYDYEGRLIAYDGLIEDITERKKAEETLYETKERLRAIFNNTAIGIALTTPHGMFVEANPNFIVMFGYPEEELFRATIADITHPDDRELTRKYIEELLAGHRHYYQFEKRYVRKTGGTFWGRITASLIKDRFGAPQFIIGAVEDISARKEAEDEKLKLQEQFIHAQKMEAVGLLAGGVAHDFNNILTAIIGYANIVKMKMKKEDPLKINLDHIINSSVRGAHLTESLLAFSRKQPVSLRPVDLNVIIRNVQKLLSRMISEDIEMLVVLDERPLTILADSGQIEQILMNLATNARDAMPDGGALTIRTETATIDERFKKEHGFGEPGRYALLLITDTGTGMDEKTKERIFEPFFTTKDVGRGTGLGLAMVYGAIKQNKGYIIVSSEPGKGATFNIYLPLLTADARREKEESLSVPIKRGTETVLLAEDDESLRMLMRSILNEFGYTVTEAKDGVEALEKFTAHQKEIALIILDVIMPRKNGREVYEEIKKIAPPVKVLFISGYTADIVHTKAILDQGLHFLSKPILPEELLKEVREILDEKVI